MAANKPPSHATLYQSAFAPTGIRLLVLRAATSSGFSNGYAAGTLASLAGQPGAHTGQRKRRPVLHQPLLMMTHLEWLIGGQYKGLFRRAAASQPGARYQLPLTQAESTAAGIIISGRKS
jgi:hypothetical protein